MTKHLNKLAWTVQEQLLRGPWPPPPDGRVLVDAWAALVAWHESGDHIYRIRGGERSPPIDANLPLASAPIRRDGQCFVIGRDKWIILGRHQANALIRVQAPEKLIGYKQPILCYATLLHSGGLSSGYFNLVDQPTPSQLHLRAGIALSSIGARQLDGEEISEEGLLLVQVLPFFYAQ